MHYLITCLILLTFTACTSTKVILLESSKPNSSIIIQSNTGEQILSKPNTYTELSWKSAPTTPKKPLTKKALEAEFGDLIQKTPKAPQSFLLYFHSDTTELIESSKQLLPLILQSIKERAPCEVSILGHTDTAGNKTYNLHVSLARAKKIHEWLLEKKLDGNQIVVEYYGESNLLIPTKDEVYEVRNRRVEVFIR